MRSHSSERASERALKLVYTANSDADETRLDCRVESRRRRRCELNFVASWPSLNMQIGHDVIRVKINIVRFAIAIVYELTFVKSLL